MLKRSKGNMYPWVTHTFNPVAGRCPHQCAYCYASPNWGREPYLKNGLEKINLGEDRTIFVCAGIDLFAEGIPYGFAVAVINKCVEYDKNIYLFQSKNPREMSKFCYPTDVIFGTTIESNVWRPELSKAPPPAERAGDLMMCGGGDRMVSIEPIMDFDVDPMLELMRLIMPTFVSIGADSKRHNLPEPPARKVFDLVLELRKFTEVKLKSNLDRIVAPGYDYSNTKK